MTKIVVDNLIIHVKDSEVDIYKQKNPDSNNNENQPDLSDNLTIDN